jgi:hypothetical protein
VGVLSLFGTSQRSTVVSELELNKHTMPQSQLHFLPPFSKLLVNFFFVSIGFDYSFLLCQNGFFCRSDSFCCAEVSSPQAIPLEQACSC